MQQKGIEAYIKYNTFDKEQKEGIKTFSNDSLYYNEAENYLTCPMGQRMEHIGDGQRITSSGFVQLISRYQARNCEGCPMRGVCHKAAGNRIVEINDSLREHKQAAKERLNTEQGIKYRKRRPIVDEIISFAGEKQIKAAFIEYKDEAYFQFILKNFRELLFNELSVNNNVTMALDSCMGKDSIPVMTVHKSKGLEYHSIIFVGLEDSAFWTYSQQPEEDKCTFFVAFSRAKRRIVFTFSRQRADKCKRVQPQAAENIKELWDSLENSGIAVRKKIV